MLVINNGTIEDTSKSDQYIKFAGRNYKLYDTIVSRLTEDTFKYHIGELVTTRNFTGIIRSLDRYSSSTDSGVKFTIIDSNNKLSVNLISDRYKDAIIRLGQLVNIGGT